MPLNRRIIIIAGPNGAGKTTFARSFLPEEAHCPRFINADLIAAGLSPFEPEAAAVKAGRLMLEEIAECVRRGESFAFETTLSGFGYRRHIDQWRSLGYHVSLYFLALPDAQIALSRVAERVKQGGHDIPEPVIRRRFAAGRRNFDEHYKDRVDAWALYDNAGPEPVLLDWGENT
ncbi:AAA family ATPase [Dyella nitratireducens]|nr:AAA family ATPase [Dyella nitratireducens]